MVVSLKGGAASWWMIVHLSFVIERSALGGGGDENLADAKDARSSCSSEDVKWNSAILSMCGLFTDTSGDWML